MRNLSTDNYEKIALIGNNSYDIKFMYYLFKSQGLEPIFNLKYEIEDATKNEILKKIAYYFGSRGPILIDNNGLRYIFNSNGIPESVIIPNLTASDIVDQINMCLESDIVYVCNSCGKLDRSTMFILGYLMAKKQEIFFWNDIEESEWLMSCISKKNITGYKETVQFPLEIVRTLAFPYLFKNLKSNMLPGQYGAITITQDGNYGIDRNTEFNLDINDDIIEMPNTICFLGSLRKQLDTIKIQADIYKNKGYTILAPQLSNVKNDTNGYVIFDDDKSDNPIIIETDFLEKCLSSEKIIVCNSGGYIGNTVMLELGYIIGKSKSVELIEQPKEQWLMDTIDYLKSKISRGTIKKIYKS